MKIARLGFLWFATALTAMPQAAPRIPAEDFAKAPLLTHVRISPDGQAIAYLHAEEGKRSLYFLEGAPTPQGNWKPVKHVRVAPNRGELVRGIKDISDYEWISARRVIFTTTMWESYLYGDVACDRDGTHMTHLSGLEARPDGDHPTYMEGPIFVFPNSNSVLMEALNIGSHDGFEPTNDVITLDTSNGLFSEIVRNRGDVVRWLPDHDGVVRLGVTLEEHSLKRDVIYRESSTAPWRTIAMPKMAETPIPLGFTEDNRGAYLSVVDSNGRWVPRILDLQTNQLGEPIWKDDTYDVISPELTPSFDDISMDRPFFSRKDHKLLGLYWIREWVVVHWFDDRIAQIQAALDRALPGNVNVITSASSDNNRFLIASYSDRNPGIYYIFDAEKVSLSKVGERMPWINPAAMAKTFGIKYKARDGLEIHGFLTVPVGAAPKDLPMVVLPHGGPWVRDAWGFDGLVQMLANRGYAVLQMNYRGSTGYGDEFKLKAKREIGGAIQTDIDDGTLWAIHSGVADPKRIAIMGGSYGGYSTLFALGKSDLYACGISIAGPTDWVRLFDNLSTDEGRYARSYWQKQIGDPVEDRARLEAVSPIHFADHIHAPLLILHGKEDRVVPISQSKSLVDVLTKAGHPPQVVYYNDTTHSFALEKSRIDMFQQIDAFLGRHVPTGKN